MRARISLAALLSVVLTVLLLGCTGADDPPGDARPSPAGTARTTPSPSVPEPPAPGPLEAYLFGDAVTSAEGWVTEITRRENLTAACMAELGFEYTPQVPAVDQITVLDGPVQGSREFVERWGYGLWSQPSNGGGGGFMYSGGDDPNWARREAMSEAAREAYDTALRGPVTATGDDGSITREGGCGEVADGPRGPEAEYLAGVRAEALAFLEALATDTRFAEVDAAWASCMADAGHTYADPAAAQQQLMDELQAEIADGVLDADVAAERAPEEIRIAVADLDCQEATGWRERHRDIEIELQQEYVDAHRADLGALAAAMDAA